MEPPRKKAALTFRGRERVIFSSPAAFPRKKSRKKNLSLREIFLNGYQ
jgi:hypothetical protein